MIMALGVFGYVAAIFHLQPVDGALVVLDFFCAQNPVTVICDGGEQQFRHGMMKAESGAGAKRESTTARL